MNGLLLKIGITIVILIVGSIPSIAGYFIYAALGAGTFWETLAALGVIVYILGGVQIFFSLAALVSIFYLWFE